MILRFGQRYQDLLTSLGQDIKLTSLGHNLVYRRRKNDRECLVLDDVYSIVSDIPCDCQVILL
jgi:hypothetical protein